MVEKVELPNKLPPEPNADKPRPKIRRLAQLPAPQPESAYVELQQAYNLALQRLYELELGAELDDKDISGLESKVTQAGVEFATHKQKAEENLTAKIAEWKQAYDLVARTLETAQAEFVKACAKSKENYDARVASDKVIKAHDAQKTAYEQQLVNAKSALADYTALGTSPNEITVKTQELEAQLKIASDAWAQSSTALETAQAEIDARVERLKQYEALGAPDYIKLRLDAGKAMAADNEELTDKLTRADAALRTAQTGLETQRERWKERLAKLTTQYDTQITELKGQIEPLTEQLQKDKTVLRSQKEVHGQLYATVKLPDGSDLTYTLGMHGVVIGADGKMCKIPDGTYSALVQKFAEAQAALIAERR